MQYVQIFLHVLFMKQSYTKLVNMISTVADNVKWTPTKNKFYSKTDKKTVDMKFHRLNVIHMYNFGM